jgi:hypothetical protein
LLILIDKEFGGAASAVTVVSVDVLEPLSVVDVVVEPEPRLSMDLPPPCEVEAVVVSGFFVEA